MGKDIPMEQPTNAESELSARLLAELNAMSSQDIIGWMVENLGKDQEQILDLTDLNIVKGLALQSLENKAFDTIDDALFEAIIRRLFVMRNLGIVNFAGALDKNGLVIAVSTDPDQLPKLTRQRLGISSEEK